MEADQDLSGGGMVLPEPGLPLRTVAELQRVHRSSLIVSR